MSAVKWVQDHATGPLPTSDGETPRAGVILVENKSDEDREQFEILGLDGILVAPDGEANTPFLNSRWAMKGVKPTAAHQGRFVVLQEPIAKDALGRAMILGVTAVKLQVDHEGLRYADVLPDDPAKLQATAAGAAILWKESGTGEKWAVIDVGPTPECTALAVMDEDLEAGSSADAKVWAIEGEGLVETDHVIEVHGWMLGEGRQAKEDDRILAAWMNGRWELVEIFSTACTDLRDPKQMPGYVEGVDQTVYKNAAGCFALGETDDDCPPVEEE